MAQSGSEKGRQVYISSSRCSGKAFAVDVLGNLAYVPNINFSFRVVEPYDIKKVIFNYPCTIVLWEDGTKTVVRCQEGDAWDKEKGLAMAIAKKFMGNKSNFNNKIKKWLGEDEYYYGKKIEKS